MSLLKLPEVYETTIYAQKKWLNILKTAQDTVQEDAEQQREAAQGVRLAGRSLPPKVVGRSYARYCDLVNKMYDAYLNNVQLQRAPYILAIITVIMKRLYELRNELVHIIVNDYIYVDDALQELHKTPMDIEIAVPYHFPLEFRSENVEKTLQQMWADALKRKRSERSKKLNPELAHTKDSKLDLGHKMVQVDEEEGEPPLPSIHALKPENYLQSIQRHERYRQWAMRDARAKAVAHRQYFLLSNEPAPIEMRIKAALLIQKTYREIMKMKRQKVRDHKLDIILGLTIDPHRSGPSFFDENNKTYERRKNMRLKMNKLYLKELEKKKTQLIIFRKDDIIEDITDEIREWFYEWFYGYNFFPQYPYVSEGGTLVVLRGDYPTVDEQLKEDEEIRKLTQGRTKAELKEERLKARAEERLKEKVRLTRQKKLDEAMIKARFDPFSDPGYKLQISGVMENLIEVIQNYRQTWSLYDDLPPELFGETIYGYMKPLLVEEAMKEIHFECRKIVDELMRLDLAMLIEKHRFDYRELGLPFPKQKARRKPKIPPKPKKLVLNEKLLKNSEIIFDLGIVTKPKTKFSDILGDSKYAAYDCNIKDPDASFPLPGYGDIKGRLMLSCVLGCGIQPGAIRRKGVLLLGPERNGKSFLADAVAGELNAVKIDITPEVFTAVCHLPEEVLSQVFVTARAFQPAVVFMRNIERVFIRKVPEEQKYLNATSVRDVLGKLVKSIPNEDKVIFIATCTDPWIANAQQMLSVFQEVLLVPRTDYGTLQQFFYQKFQSIISMPRDYPVQPIAQLVQGYGFADIIEVYNEVMTPERIVRLSVQQLSSGEFIQVFGEKGKRLITLEDYQKYVDFFIQNSELKKDREEYTLINTVRADVYMKEEKKKKKEKVAIDRSIDINL